MDHMEASCVIYVMVGIIDQLEQNKLDVSIGTTLGIVLLTIQHDLIVSLCFM